MCKEDCFFKTLLRCSDRRIAPVMVVLDQPPEKAIADNANQTNSVETNPIFWGPKRSRVDLRARTTSMGLCCSSFHIPGWSNSPFEINQNVRTLLWNMNSLEQWSMSGLHSVVEYLIPSTTRSMSVLQFRPAHVSAIHHMVSFLLGHNI